MGQCAGEGSPGASKTVQDSPRLAEVTSDTTAASTPPRPLAADDDTAAFDCGRDALNHWFRRHAWRNQELGVSRTTVICDAEAVSYTHLDVYKRQSSDSTFVSRSRRSIRRSSGPSPNSVSYTHLDVYKRQALHWNWFTQRFDVGSQA